jgi:hypothetical protein
MNIAPYKTSKDYARLWQLAKTMRVICIVDYGDHGCRDVCKTLYRESERGGITVELSARGISYVCAYNLVEFTKHCEADHVEFILPETETKKEPDPIFMSIETFHRLRNLIQHSTSPEQNTYTYGGRLISIVSKKTIHDCSEHTMSDGTCAVCGKEQLP